MADALFEEILVTDVEPVSNLGEMCTYNAVASIVTPHLALGFWFGGTGGTNPKRWETSRVGVDGDGDGFRFGNVEHNSAFFLKAVSRRRILHPVAIVGRAVLR